MVGNEGRNRDDFGPDEEEPFGDGLGTDEETSSSQVARRRVDNDDEEPDEDAAYAPRPRPKKKKGASAGGSRRGVAAPVIPAGTTVFFDLPYNVAAALCYIPIVPAVAGVLWLMTESKDNDYLRFHSFQSIAFTIATVGILVLIGTAEAILAVIPVIGGVLAFMLLLARIFIGLIFTGLLLRHAISVFNKKEGRLPVIADFAERLKGTFDA